MRSTLAVLAALTALGASVITATGAGATSARDPIGAPGSLAVDTGGYLPDPIAFGPCTNPRLVSAGAECGMLTVPMDYARQNGTTIQIAVSRIRHTSPDSEYQGIALTNPGGPGGSGLTLSRLGAFLPNGAGDSYDWIGFDPRGVGSSVPALSCDGDYFPTNRPNYVPTTAALERFWLTTSAGYAADCAAAGGELLDHVRTIDNVKDMESIRKALGEKQINYYGFSYGTYLGQVYSTLYPQRVRRMVWDGVVDPRGVWYDANLKQDAAFDRNINIYFAWIARHDATYHLGTTQKEVRSLWYRTLRQLERTPAMGRIGPDEWTDAFLSAGYYVYGWQTLAADFSSAINDGDWEPMLNQYLGVNGSGPGSDNGFAMYLATQCTDVRWPKAWSTWKRDNWAVYAKHPFETWANAWFNAPCLTWAGTVGRPVEIDGRNTPPILLIAETNDAATPYPGALEVRRRYPRSVLIEGVGGTTHSGSLSGIACTDNAIAGYFINGALPTRRAGRTSDLECDPVPQPDPAPTARRAGPVGQDPELGALLRAAQRR